MITWALEVEYDGSPFMGWQRQKHGLAIQQVMEEAASKICGGVAPAAVGSGRTDAGVHATGQVVQMELPELAPVRIREALNFHMKPHPVAILRAAPAPAGWNARFSALSRTYKYVILNREVWPVLESGRVWHVRAPLEADRMDRAAKRLLGNHDFSSFRAAACQAKSPVKTLDELNVRREGEHVVVHAKARSFLHHQVRNIVGTLKMVGDGSWPEQKVTDVLAARDRAAAAAMADAAGLYLVRVGYEQDVFTNA